MSVKIDAVRWRCEHRHTCLEHPVCWQRFLKEHGENEKVGYFDLETSNLKADFGWIISWCIKHAGMDKFEGYVLKKRDYKAQFRDRECTYKLVQALGKFDRIVTYYGSRFDIPFARTRTLIHGLQFIPPRTLLHLDLYYQVRGKLRLSRNRLGNCGEAFDLATEKTRISTKAWSNVGLSFDKEALAYIWDHNKKDTVLLEELHKKLMPYIIERRTYL